MIRSTLWAFATLSLVLSGVGCSGDLAPATDATQEDLVTGQFAFKPGVERQARFSADNGYWLSLLSGASYAKPEALLGPTGAFAGVGIDLSKPGYEFKFFDVARTDGQAFYLATPNAAFLVFRGTLEQKDWATDFDTGPKGGRVHKGYAGQAESLWNESGMREFVRARHSKEAPGKPLYVAGHSMGGALAVLVTHLALFDECQKIPGWTARSTASPGEACRAHYVPVEATYTFGQPLVGNSAFADLLAARVAETGGSYVRVVNADDGVPAFPKDLGFVHLETKKVGRSTLVGLSRAGRLNVGVDPKGIDDRVQDTVPGRSMPAPPKDTCGDRSGNDHNITTYASKIRASANGVAWKATETCQ